MHYSFHSTPTCTFKSRTEKVTKANQLSSVPGPADYQTHTNNRHQCPTIADTHQDRKLFRDPPPNPGPGTYSSKSHITDGDKKTMSARYPEHVKQAPGPQDYKVAARPTLNEAPHYSLGPRSVSEREIDVRHNEYKPAPVSYNTRTSPIKQQGVVMGSSQRKDLTETEKTPAGSSYKAEEAYKFSNTANPRANIGREFRKTTGFMHAEATPGPAGYRSSSFIEENQSKGKGFSCRQRVEDLVKKEVEKMPAPGHYEAHLKNKNTAPQFSSSKSLRKTFMDSTQDFKKVYPGPGIHDPKFAGTKYRSASLGFFGKSHRKPLDEQERTPGPAEYKSEKIKVLSSAPQFTPGKTVPKNEFLQVNPEQPGPGQYNPQHTLVKSKSQVNEVPKEQRPDFEKQKRLPGPGYYNLRGKEEGPQWRFGSTKRVAFTDNRNEAKHGSHYDIASKVVDPPGYMSVQSKLTFKERSSSLKALK